MDIKLNERWHSQKDAFCMVSFIWHSQRQDYSEGGQISGCQGLGRGKM